MDQSTVCTLESERCVRPTHQIFKSLGLKFQVKESTLVSAVQALSLLEHSTAQECRNSCVRVGH